MTIKEAKKKKEKIAGKGIKKLKTTGIEKEEVEKQADPITIAGAAAE